MNNDCARLPISTADIFFPIVLRNHRVPPHLLPVNTLSLFNLFLTSIVAHHPKNRHVRRKAYRKSSLPPADKTAQSGELNPRQEYADLQKNPLEGMDISLVSESDMHKWLVVIAGPKDSPYVVRSPPCGSLLSRNAHPRPPTSELTPSSGWLLQPRPHPPRRLPVQTADPELPNQNLPPECDQRRQRQHVPRHATAG